jgi:predicted site-specific integrase-resolvase
MAQNLVRLKTCAEQRNISVVSLRRYISQGKLTAYRLGPKIIMVDLNELDAVVLKRIPTVSGGA